jgi:hypothetical protein
MDEHGLPEEFTGILRPMQIVVGALTAGVLVFLCIAVGLRWSGKDFGVGDSRIISYASAAALVFGVLARAALLAGLATQGRKQIAAGKWRDGSGVTGTKPWTELIEREGDRGRLLALYQSHTVIGAAILEAVGLLGCVAYLIEGGWIGIGIAVAVIGLMIALQFPTRQAAADWVDGQAKLL